MAGQKILAFAGSTREGSYNKKLVKIAAAAARAAGAEVTVVDLRDLPMPLFDQDLETHEGLPAHARRLKELFLAHQGLLLSCPEYNSSMSGVFKNAIDWVSRPAPGETPLGCFMGKVAALMSASPGALGGLRGLVHVRAMLGNPRPRPPRPGGRSARSGSVQSRRFPQRPQTANGHRIPRPQAGRRPDEALGLIRFSS